MNTRHWPAESASHCCLLLLLLLAKQTVNSKQSRKNSTMETILNTLISHGSRGLWIQHPLQRELTLSTQCQGFSSYATPFNEDNAVIPYFGIMFSIDSFDQPFDITTLELDLRCNGTIEDYNVTVYMYRNHCEHTNCLDPSCKHVAGTINQRDERPDLEALSRQHSECIGQDGRKSFYKRFV